MRKSQFGGLSFGLTVFSRNLTMLLLAFTTTIPAAFLSWLT
jgi:hypothetical protein